jgi:type II secretory pathway predicted ATPase ExeA
MTAAYLSAFGLKDPPFSKEIPDGDLWLPPSKQPLVDQLLEALEARASVLLVGEPGVGKTCVLRALRHRIPTAGFRLTYCHNATLGRRDFYRQLCVALGLSPSATAAAVFYAVSTHVQDLASERVHPVFLLDEAHLLHQDTLDHLHILLNYEWDSRALLSLVLVGLPELAARLSLRRNRSLSSRIHHRLAIAPLQPEDTAEYIRLRLRRVGCDREVFASDALALLHEATVGAMRDIDRLAAAALREAARKKKRLVERDIIARVIDADSQLRSQDEAA